MGKSSVNGPFYMAMLNNQRVLLKKRSLDSLDYIYPNDEEIQFSTVQNCLNPLHWLLQKIYAG